jgi:RNA polymerase sigma-70 factor, ECF subfamily
MEVGERVMTDTADEERIVAAMRRGERRAAEELAERTYSLVFAVLARLCDGDRELAGDLTQETYRRAWQAIAQFDGRSRFSTWLYRIAYTTFLNHIRTPRRVVPLDDSSSIEIPDRSPGADEMAERNEADRQLRRAVLALPDDLRFLVTAHYWGDASIADIAVLEKVTTVAIRKRLRKALDQLQSALQKGRS